MYRRGVIIISAAGIMRNHMYSTKLDAGWLRSAGTTAVTGSLISRSWGPYCSRLPSTSQATPVFPSTEAPHLGIAAPGSARLVLPQQPRLAHHLSIPSGLVLSILCGFPFPSRTYDCRSFFQHRVGLLRRCRPKRGHSTARLPIPARRFGLTALSGPIP